MNGVGIAAAVVLFVSLNVLGARFFTRWDATREGLYTLSPPTIETLKSLKDPLEVVVFMSRRDPLTSSVGYMLDAYRTHTTQLDVTFVDPDRDPAHFIALQRKYGIFEGKTDNGRLATEASIVVVRGEKHWFITTDDMVALDDEQAATKPKLEQALTEGIAAVLGRQKVKVCLTQGHQELGAAAGGPQGIGELRALLDRNNYETRAVDLALGEPTAALNGCQLVLVVGPLAPFASEASAALAEHVADGGSLLLAVGPIVDDSGAISDPGLERLTAPWGVHLQRSLVFERDDTLSLPIGFGGEVFLATPLVHPTTQALMVGPDARLRVVFQLAGEVALDDASSAVGVLQSSKRAISVGSFKALANGEFVDAPGDAERKRFLAAAFERPVQNGQSRGARVVVMGSASPLWSSTWIEPSLLGTRRFVEGAISWLAAQPPLISVPEKSAQPAGLFLTEDSLSEVQRYVLLYVPLTVLALALLVLFKRRSDNVVETSREGADS
jgi:hypothetical protein